MIVRRHLRKGKVVKKYYRRGKPGRLVVDKRSTRTVPIRDSKTGRVWGRKRVGGK